MLLQGGRLGRGKSADEPNAIWRIDFGADQPADGRLFRALTVADQFTLECLAIETGH